MSRQSRSQRLRSCLTHIGHFVFYCQIRSKTGVPRREKSRCKPGYSSEIEFVSYNAVASSEFRSSGSCRARKTISGLSVSSRSKGSNACRTAFRTLAEGFKRPLTRTSISSFVSFAEIASVTWRKVARASFDTPGTSNKTSRSFRISSTLGRS